MYMIFRKIYPLSNKIIIINLSKTTQNVQLVNLRVENNKDKVYQRELCNEIKGKILNK